MWRVLKTERKERQGGGEKQEKTNGSVEPDE
jgi:hypothetical protein